MITLFELPEATEAIVRDLSGGRLRRTPGARIIPGVAAGTLRREQQERLARLRAEAAERRQRWADTVWAIHQHHQEPRPRVGPGFSARKAQLMGRAHRSRADEPKPRPGHACEPLGVNLPGWTPEVDL